MTEGFRLPTIISKVIDPKSSLKWSTTTKVVSFY